MLSLIEEYSTTIVAICAALTAVFSISMGLGRYWLGSLKRIIHEEVETRTELIQPNSNGGSSLTDISTRVSSLEEKVDCISDSVSNISINMKNLQDDSKKVWELLIKKL